MAVLDLIRAYLEAQPEPKRTELITLHNAFRALVAEDSLTYLDGTDGQGKVVSNPSIGYGRLTLLYADGSSRPYYQIGLSANTGGISVYVMGLEDKHYLPQTYGPALGKAKVTSYCIQFKRLGDIDQTVLLAAVRDGIARTKTE